MMKRTFLILLMLVVTTALILFFGAQWASSEGSKARTLREEEMVRLMAGAASSAQQEMAELLATSREDGGSLALDQFQRLRVRYRPEPPQPDLGRVFASAEQLEFVEGNSTAALQEYERLLGESLTPTARVTALRNAARLRFLLKEDDKAQDALAEAVRITDASDPERLLAYYELAEKSDMDRQRFLAELEESRFPGVPPGRRAFIHEKLGGDPARIVHLRAGAAVIEGEDPENLAALSDSQVCWRLAITGDWVEIGLIPLDPLLQALIPGWAEGQWILVDEETPSAVSLGKPFPPLHMALSEAALDNLEDHEDSTFSRSFLMAGLPALLLIATSLFLLISDLRAARLEKRRRNFLWSITHEFKTPIANILLFAETIHRHASKDPEGMRGFAQTIGAEAQRLHQRVQQALDVAAGKQAALSPTQPFDLGQVLDELMAEYRASAEHRQIELSYSGPEAPLRMTGTRDLVIRAICGVMDNALKFAAREVRVSLAAGAQTLVIRVEDDGPGIPKKEREAVFAPFVQLADVETRTSSGTGLGLTFVRQCAESDKGKVHVEESKLGGAALLIEYPLS